MPRFYLLFSAAGLFAIALSYGVAPAAILPKVLDLSVEGTDLTHIFRAVMGLYLAMIVLWVLGALRPNLTSAAVIAEVAFMFGLAFGRVLSIIADEHSSSAMRTRLAPSNSIHLATKDVVPVWGHYQCLAISPAAFGAA